MPEQTTGEAAGADVILPQFDFAMRQMADALTALRQNAHNWKDLVRLAIVEYCGVDETTLTKRQLQQLDHLAEELERANQEKLNPELLQQRRAAGGREV